MGRRQHNDAPSDDSGRERLRRISPPPPEAHSPVIRGQFTGLAVLSVLAGVCLLLENFGFLPGVYRLWPVFPGFLGIGLTLLFFQRGRADLVLFGMGSYLIGASLLFFVLNFTSWSALNWAWPTFVALLGVSSSLAAAFAGTLRRMLFLSGTFLVLLAACFYAVFGLSPKLWPISLVLFGLWLLLLARPRSKRDHMQEED
jgi:uncharacterized metal-binding protein